MKKSIANAALAVSVVLIAAVLIYGAVRGSRKQETAAGQTYTEPEEDFYHIDAHTLADFSDVLTEQFSRESDLVVWSADASVSVDLKEIGLMDFNIFNKTQRITYKGTGRFYVDLSALGRHSIRLDNDNATITIEIPHAELAEIEIDPDRFIYEEAEKGLLAFGELKFTAQEYNGLETECKRRIRDAVDIQENRQTADKRAVEEMTKLYEPIVKAVDDTYSVKIVFRER